MISDKIGNKLFPSQFQVVLQPGEGVPENHVLLGGHVAVPQAWMDHVARKGRNLPPNERVKLMLDGLVRPQQLALYGGVARFRGTYLEPLLTAMEGKCYTGVA